jgi:hypothetical protein
MRRRQKVIATTTPVSPPLALSCFRSSSKSCSSSVSRDASWLVHYGYGTGARPVLFMSAGAGLSR